ncbi:sensor domain-containing diguanylate cyclase [Ferrimonas marina]|uniref:diguanylate cyclase n=1 Tax=Ferrimonas marina TaxID=299255 RepID=A0A1M5XP72_9GAMM|nr:diguanylate cyclase [Ferrimonas marina]SHI01452.1 diguanylate cyclase (GGDEF) domain-containing protein [Ferrimonas marina]
MTPLHQLEHHAEAQWQRLLDTLAQATGMPGVYLARCTEVELHVLSTNQGCPPQAAAGERFPIFDLFCEQVMRQAKVVQVEDVAADPQWQSGREASAGVQCYLGMPVRDPQGEVFATLCLFDTKAHPLPEAWQSLMRSVVAIIEGELAMLSLCRELDGLARQDPVTGLANRRALELGLPAMKEWGLRQQSSLAGSHPLGVVLMELDQFAELLVRAGLSGAEHALTLVGQVLGQSLRPQDMLVRWSEARLLLLVSGVRSEDLLAQAEQLRCAVQRLPMLDGEGMGLTVSMGVMVWSGEGHLPISLLEQRLRQAQEAGHNRCVMARSELPFAGPAPLDQGEQAVKH